MTEFTVVRESTHYLHVDGPSPDEIDKLISTAYQQAQRHVPDVLDGPLTAMIAPEKAPDPYAEVFICGDTALAVFACLRDASHEIDNVRVRTRDYQ